MRAHHRRPFRYWPRCCDHACRRGIHVAVASTRAGTPAAKDAEAQLSAAASDVRWKSQQIDIRNTTSVNDGVAAIAADLGPMTILVNAAGTYNHEAIAGHSDDQWEDTIASNLSEAVPRDPCCLAHDDGGRAWKGDQYRLNSSTYGGTGICWLLFG